MKEPVTLVIMRGLPGSGKTTWARKWVAKDRAVRVRVCRDDLREMADDGEFAAGITEPRILTARDAAIRAWLGSGVSVVADETNLTTAAVSALMDIAREMRVAADIHDLSQVPLNVCLERNSFREGRCRLPEARIREMHEQMLRSCAYGVHDKPCSCMTAHDPATDDFARQAREVMSRYEGEAGLSKHTAERIAAQVTFIVDAAYQAGREAGHETAH